MSPKVEQRADYNISHLSGKFFFTGSQTSNWKGASLAKFGEFMRSYAPPASLGLTVGPLHSPSIRHGQNSPSVSCYLLSSEHLLAVSKFSCSQVCLMFSCFFLLPLLQEPIELMFCSYWWFVHICLYFGSHGEIVSRTFVISVYMDKSYAATVGFMC